MLGSPEEWAAAGWTVVSFAFSTRPFNTPLFITVFSHLFAPQGNGAFHYPHAGGKAEILDHTARPFLTLMAGVVPLI